jgi:diacylglycerol O-acyltransferase / wax synthase
LVTTTTKKQRNKTRTITNDAGLVLSPVDLCFWELGEDNTQQTIGVLLQVEGSPSLPVLYTQIEDAIKRIPKLSKIIKSETKSWEEYSSFSIDSQVEYSNHPKITDWKELENLASKRLSLGLDLTKPLWRICVFCGKSESAVLYLFHHAFADGVSGVSLLHEFCSPLEKDLKKRPKAFHLKSAAIQKGARTKRFLGLITELKRNIPSSLNGKNSKQRKINSIAIPLEEFNKKRRENGISQNDLLLALVSSALSKYTELNSIPTKNFLSALIPVNLREDENMLGLGNQLSALKIKMPISHHLSILQRATIIKKTFADVDFHGSYEFLGKAIALLPKIIRKQLLRMAQRKVDLICTTVPGPKQFWTIGGAKIVAEYGLPALMLGHGLGFAFIRYGNVMGISLVSDPNIIKKPEEIIKLINAAFIELDAENCRNVSDFHKGLPQKEAAHTE